MGNLMDFGANAKSDADFLNVQADGQRPCFSPADNVPAIFVYSFNRITVLPACTPGRMIHMKVSAPIRSGAATRIARFFLIHARLRSIPAAKSHKQMGRLASALGDCTTKTVHHTPSQFQAKRRTNPRPEDFFPDSAEWHSGNHTTIQANECSGHFPVGRSDQI